MKSTHLEAIRAFGTVLIIFVGLGAGLAFPLSAPESYNWPLVIAYMEYAVIFYFVMRILQAHLANQERMISNQEILVRHFMPNSVPDPLFVSQKETDDKLVVDNLKLKK